MTKARDLANIIGTGGNLTITGTVDGRDVAADGTKLDGIEAGATADQTAAEILTAIKTVDGAGSGLDADLLDGQNGAYYTGYTDTAIANLVATAPTTLDTLNELAAALGNDPNFATTVSASIGTKLDAASYTAADVLSKLITVDGAASGLDADLLDGNHASAFSLTSHNHTLDSLSNTTITTIAAGEILKWNGTAWINNTLAEAGIQPAGSYLTGNQTITLTGDVSGSGTTSISVTVADDSHNHIIANVDGLQAALDGKLSTSGKAADSNLLDGIDSSAFVRSNAADEISITGGLPLSIRRTGSSSAATNGRTLEVVQNYGDHSWGIVSEFRVDGTAGSDRPSILFSTGYNTDTWSVGFGGTDSNFRINRDHGHRNSSWGTTLMNMDRSGNVTFSGNVTAYSDERLKSDIQTIENAVDTVKALRGVTFVKDGKPSLGVVAQEVQAVLPELVMESGNYLSVAYGNMVGVLIEAIKEQQAQIDDLKAKLGV